MAFRVNDLRARGVRSKCWTTAKGVQRQGKLIDKGYLYKMLKNPVYNGIATHKGKDYPGEHEAIVAQALWDKVQSSLKEGVTRRKGPTRATSLEGPYPAAWPGFRRRRARFHAHLHLEGQPLLPLLHQHRGDQDRHTQLRCGPGARRRDRSRRSRAAATGFAVAGGACTYGSGRSSPCARKSLRTRPSRPYSPSTRCGTPYSPLSRPESFKP